MSGLSNWVSRFSVPKVGLTAGAIVALLVGSFCWGQMRSAAMSGAMHDALTITSMLDAATQHLTQLRGAYERAAANPSEEHEARLDASVGIWWNESKRGDSMRERSLRSLDRVSASRLHNYQAGVRSSGDFLHQLVQDRDLRSPTQSATVIRAIQDHGAALRQMRTFAVGVATRQSAAHRAFDQAFWLGWFGSFALACAFGFWHVRRNLRVTEARTIRLEDELSRTVRYLELVDAVFRASRRVDDVDKVIHSVMSEVARISDWELGHVLRVTPAGGLQSTREWYARDTQKHLRFRRVTDSIVFQTGEDLPGGVLDSGNSVWYEDLETCTTSRRIRIAGRDEIVSGFAFPIHCDGAVVAVIELLDTRVRPIDGNLLDVSKFIAAHLGHLLERDHAVRAEMHQADALKLQQAELELQQQLLDVQQESLNEQRVALEQMRAELERERNRVRNLTIEERPATSTPLTEEARDLYVLAARRFEELFHGVPIACFTTDDNGLVFEWNSSAQDLWGHIGPQVIEQEASSLLVAPDSKSTFEDLLARALGGESIEHFELECEDRIGRRFWVLGSVFPTRGPNRTITGAVWSCMDITLRKEVEDELRGSEQILRTTMESLQSGVIMFDPNGRIEMVNPRMAELLRMTPAALQDATFRIEQLDPIDLDGNAIPPERLPHLRCIANGTTTGDDVVGFRRVDGMMVWFNVSVTPVIDSARGAVRCAVASFVDISRKIANERNMRESLNQIKLYSSELESQKVELALANAQLEKLATTDGLTGLRNYRSFNEFLQSTLELAKRHGDWTTVLLIDVDHFKQYNDAFGHPAGDAVLRKVAQILTAHVREVDLAARYGGEEFAVVLPHTAPEAGVAIAERIREAVGAHQWTNREITISIGVAATQGGQVERVDLVEAADQALYASKQNGRNRVTFKDTERRAA